jgi:hypothetical protein
MGTPGPWPFDPLCRTDLGGIAAERAVRRQLFSARIPRQQEKFQVFGFLALEFAPLSLPHAGLAVPSPASGYPLLNVKLPQRKGFSTPLLFQAVTALPFRLKVVCNRV